MGTLESSIELDFYNVIKNGNQYTTHSGSYIMGDEETGNVEYRVHGVECTIHFDDSTPVEKVTFTPRNEFVTHSDTFFSDENKYKIAMTWAGYKFDDILNANVPGKDETKVTLFDQNSIWYNAEVFDSSLHDPSAENPRKRIITQETQYSKIAFLVGKLSTTLVNKTQNTHDSSFGNNPYVGYRENVLKVKKIDCKFTVEKMNLASSKILDVDINYPESENFSITKLGDNTPTPVITSDPGSCLILREHRSEYAGTIRLASDTNFTGYQNADGSLGYKKFYYPENAVVQLYEIGKHQASNYISNGNTASNSSIGRFNKIQKSGFHKDTVVHNAQTNNRGEFLFTQIPRKMYKVRYVYNGTRHVIAQARETEGPGYFIDYEAVYTQDVAEATIINADYQTNKINSGDLKNIRMMLTNEVNV